MSPKMAPFIVPKEFIRQKLREFGVDPDAPPPKPKDCEVCGEPEVMDGTCVMKWTTSERTGDGLNMGAEPQHLCRTHLEAVRIEQPGRVTYDSMASLFGTRKPPCGCACHLDEGEDEEGEE